MSGNAFGTTATYFILIILFGVIFLIIVCGFISVCCCRKKKQPPHVEPINLPELHTNQRHDTERLYGGVENTSQFDIQAVQPPGVPAPTNHDIPELKQKAMLTIGKSGINRECEVCVERPKDTLFAPCGHVFAWFAFFFALSHDSVTCMPWKFMIHKRCVQSVEPTSIMFTKFFTLKFL